MPHDSRPIYILVNGILSNPGDSDQWTDHGVTWLHQRAGINAQCEKFEYFARALTRRFKQDKHSTELAQLIASYEGRELHVVTHSNGADLLIRALRKPELAEIEIESAHLIAAACEEDFSTNGLNAALAAERLGSIYVYASENDGVLKYFARPSRFLLGWANLGYGLLGLRGPINVARAISPAVVTTWKNHHGHSTWFKGEHFAETFYAILTNDQK